MSKMVAILVLVALAIVNKVAAVPVDSFKFFITNGALATETREFPYVASLEVNGLLVCGAVIIKPNVVLTTARCTEGFFAENLVVRAGTLIREDKKGEHIQVRKVRSTLIHPAFKAEGSLDNDVSLVYLDQDFEFDQYVNAVDLTGEDYTQEDATIIGWGKNEHFEETDNLMIAEISLISNEKCAVAYKSKETITSTMICGTSSNRQVICNDNGSPMVLHYPKNPRNDKLIGLAAYSEVKRVHKNHLKGGAASLVQKTCDTSMPSIFTRISAVSEWILSMS